MNFSKYGKASPFRAPLRKDDIGVNKPSQLTEDEVLNEAEKIGSNLLMRSLKREESPNLQLVPEPFNRNNTPDQVTKVNDERAKLNPEEEAQRNKHIQELIEELNFNRTRYEKLLNDHAEEKRYWMNYIKQLEAERDRLYNK
jgi:hypothetical protein